MGDGDDQQQDLAGGGHVEAGQGQHEDRVEVQAAQVGPQPARAGQPVGVGDVGEERRPDQVDADADHAGPRAAIPASGRVPALVEHGGNRRQAEHDQQVHRVTQHLLESSAQPVDGEEPPVHGQDAGGHGHDHRPAEQRPQQRPGGVCRTLGQERAPRPQRQQRVGRRRGGRSGRIGDDAQGQQLVGDQIAGLLGGQDAAKVRADQFGDSCGAAGAVDPADHLVQQRRYLDDLAVGPPYQRRRLAVTGVLVLAEQLHPVGQPGHPGEYGHARRERGGRWPPGRHVPGDCGHHLLLLRKVTRGRRGIWARRPGRGAR